MSEELDRKIAELVMGEPEPTYPIPDRAVMRGTGVITSGHFSKKGNWEALDLYPGGPTWKPLPFSTNLDLAMRAVEKLLGEDAGFGVEYDGGVVLSWYVYPFDGPARGEASTLSEAICRLLLDLVEKP